MEKPETVSFFRDVGGALIGGTADDTVQSDGLTKSYLDNGEAPSRINSGYT